MTAEPQPARRPIRAWLAVGAASAGLLVLASLASTVAGTSDLARAAAAGGEEGALAAVGSTLGFGIGVILTIVALILAIDPLISGRGRRVGIAAVCIVLAAPIVVGGLSAVLG